MSQVVLSQIEQSIFELPADERLLLIGRVAEKLRRRFDDDNDFEAQLAEMAANENIQRELKEIEQDFRCAEQDGLDKW